MKTLKIVFFFILISGQLTAQSNTLTETLDALEKTTVLSEYKKFKLRFEQMNTNVGAQLTSMEEYNTLNMAYNRVEEEYNGFLNEIRKDLSKTRQIRSMVNKPARFANKYLDEYQVVVDLYESEYLPVYQNLQTTSAKPITPMLIRMGITVIVDLVNIILGRERFGEQHLDNILGLVNENFYQKFRMKRWDELNIPKPNATPFAEAESEMYEETSDILNGFKVEPPIFDNLNGWVEFFALNEQYQPVPMPFSAPLAKRIIVGTIQNNRGQLEAGQASISTSSFNSTQFYGEGTQFNIKVQNSGGMYIFALDQYNDVEFLYPYKRHEMPCIENNLPGIEIPQGLQGTFVIGQNSDGVTTLPTPDCSVTPAEERYFTITGSAEQEVFCVLLTRSEMDLDQLELLLEAEQGPINERLTRVLGEQAVSADPSTLQMQDNKLVFNSQGPGLVLPIVFYINRQ